MSSFDYIQSDEQATNWEEEQAVWDSFFASEG